MKIAVIAHDGKKADMVAFIMKRLDFLKKTTLLPQVPQVNILNMRDLR